MQDELTFNLHRIGYDEASTLRLQPKKGSTRIDGYEPIRRTVRKVCGEPKSTTERSFAAGKLHF